jgi:hypothetical protein
MAGQADFTPDEWWTLRRATMASGVLVSLAEGVVDGDEMLALRNRRRLAEDRDASQLVRELAGSGFSTGLQPDTTYSSYEGPALEAIRSAAAIIARSAPADLEPFRAFLVGIAEAVADANEEGGFLGMGSQKRTANEARAIAAVKRALGLGN